ncbi:hypothetical protein QQ045_000669 [Rhodiola kirilowii]
MAENNGKGFVVPSIPKFDGHYDHWAKLMENFIRSKEYWDLIEHGILSEGGSKPTDAHLKLSRLNSVGLVSMAGSGHARPPDTHQKVVPHPQVGGHASGPSSNAPTFTEVTKGKQLGKNERRFPPIQLAARQYGSKDGKPSISFSAAEQQVGIDNLKHSLVAKFS